jgi:RNA polymerase sigma-70 factor (ECF subfamily)
MAIHSSPSDPFIQHLKEHDPESFDLLYSTFGDKVFNLAYRMTGNEEDASDITQETFFQVYLHINSFRADSSLYTWIFAIARNQCFHLYKKRNNLSFVSFERAIQAAAGESLPAGIAESEKIHLANQVKEGCLTGLVRCLTFNQRMAFILHVLLNLPIEDVSSILDKSENATKVLIHRARANLKIFLCKNCSLYLPSNFCQCKNMVGFSLKQGWISLEGNNTQANIRIIEDEVQNFHKIIEFYTRLNPPMIPQTLHDRVRTLMEAKDWAIFKDKEV